MLGILRNRIILDRPNNSNIVTQIKIQEDNIYKMGRTTMEAIRDMAKRILVMEVLRNRLSSFNNLTISKANKKDTVKMIVISSRPSKLTKNNIYSNPSSRTLSQECSNRVSIF